ncbi:MAG: hypothetical protein P8X63_08685, partial [Desulfuromonadaceae bacterium]
LFNNGDWFGFIPAESYPETARLLDFTPQGLPFAIRSPTSVLVLNAGTGLTAAQALNHRATKVVAVEPHRAALALLRHHYPQTTGTFFAGPQIQLATVEPRTWLAGDRHRYDLVLLPTLGAFGGTAGVFALHEQYSLTREAFTSIWRHLTPDGILCLSAWMDYPPRTSLRLAATLVDLLNAEGITDPTSHLVAVRGWGTVSFCLKRSALNADEITRIRRFCNDLGFDPLLLPGLRPEERDRFNQLPDQALFQQLDRIISGDHTLLYADYLFNIQPTDDNRPFFSQFLRWQTLPYLTELFGRRVLPAMELGTLVVLVTFVLTAAAAVVLILLPLLRLGWRGGRRSAVIGYFGGLGLGYMLVEIVLIHHCVLYLGHPVQAAAAVICALLLGSGIGSASSSRLPSRFFGPQRTSALIALVLIPYPLLLKTLLGLTIPLEESWRMPLALLLLIPIGFIMGLPFPLGLGQLHRRQPEAVPWAWGINGCLSVLGTSLATLIAIQAGFHAVTIAAAGSYGCASLAGCRLFAKQT